MSAAKVIVAAAAVGLGLYLVSRSSAASSSPAATRSSPTGPATLKTTFTPLVPNLPGLAQAYAIAKPIADNVTTPIIHDVNKTVGGSDIYANLTRNPDGSYTDGTGARITLNASGTITRTANTSKTPNWYYNNIGHPISMAGTAVVHLISGLL